MVGLKMKLFEHFSGCDKECLSFSGGRLLFGSKIQNSGGNRSVLTTKDALISNKSHILLIKAIL